MQSFENLAEIHKSCLINETCELTPHVQFHLYKSLMLRLLSRKWGWVQKGPKYVQETRINYKRGGARLDI